MNSAKDGDIYFLAHPDLRLATKGGFLGVQWMNHEKLLVVDQSMALLGGIDLCIGRYGEHGKYSLFDSSEEKFKGADYFNSFENPDWEKPRKDLKRFFFFQMNLIAFVKDSVSRQCLPIIRRKCSRSRRAFYPALEFFERENQQFLLFSFE